ncbi:MAG: sulfurtransferase, partial [Candidatus Aminicenantes bacterium]|nr:sulfurtransferase [Candidatus Aminicenantes bacterium]
MPTTEPKRYRRLLAAVLPLLLALASGLRATDLPGKIVSSEWLAQNLKTPGLRILDLRTDIREYWESHIPGAVYIDPVVVRWTDKAVPGKFMPAQAFAMLLGELGIKETTPVVVYSEKNNYKAAYFIWAFDYIRHANAALLDRGFDNWRREGRATTQDYPSITAVPYRLPASFDEEVRAGLEDVRKALSGPDVLIDARPADMYAGDKGTWKRKGHIKGAKSRPWSHDLNEDGSWRSVDGLRTVYQAMGVTPDVPVIAYCGQGQMAAMVYVTLKYVLGHPRVRLYDGSFSEWSVRADLPV